VIGAGAMLAIVPSTERSRGGAGGRASLQIFVTTLANCLCRGPVL